MKLALRSRRGVRVLGVLLGLLSLVLSLAILLFGLQVPPVLVLVPMLVVLALAAAALRRAFAERHERLAWFMLATAGLWIMATTAFLELLHMEGDLVSESRSVAVVDAFMWPVFVLGVAAFVALLLMGTRLLTQHPRRTTLPRT
jgi:hypothetical protein